MKSIWTASLMLIAQTCFAQGINFEKYLNWEQVKEQAKKDNKNIFVDVYATWCAPCKKMDRDVYTNNLVAKFANNNFVSIKLQQDKTPNDSEEIKNRYLEANRIISENKVLVLPTYLFFTSDGKIIYKEDGFQDVAKFIEILKMARDTTTQSLYSDLDKYRKGESKLTEFQALSLIKRTRDLIGDRELSWAMAKIYKNQYIDKLDIEELCKKEYLEFIASYLKLFRSKDNVFKLVTELQEKADKEIGQEGWSERVRTSIISMEEIYDQIYTDDTWTKFKERKPTWKLYNSNIIKKYGDKYSYLGLPVEIYYYQEKKDWKSYATVINNKNKRFPPQVKGPAKNTAWDLNVAAWGVFLDCPDKGVLKQALKWSQWSIDLEQPKPNEQYLDTKANLLYKLGFVKEAIQIEKEAIRSGVERVNASNKGGVFPTSIFLEMISKMERGHPTWRVSGSQK